MTASLVLINARVWSPDGVGAGCDAIVAEEGRITALTTGAHGQPPASVTVLGGDILPAHVAGDDGDAPTRHVDVTQDEGKHALADAAEAYQQNAAGEFNMDLMRRHQ